MLGKLAVVAGREAERLRLGRERRRRRQVAGDDRVAAEKLAGVAREAAVDPVGEEADRGQRADRERHRDDEQAQLAGAEVAQQLAPAELPGGGDGRRQGRGEAVGIEAGTYTSRERCVQRG
jgi:hypothetical protein